MALALGFAVLASGCRNLSGNYPHSHPLLPDMGIRLSAGEIISLEKLAMTAGAAGVLYAVYDPLAPNWSIEETPLDAETYHLSLRAKSFRTGGDGEALQIFKRRARQLQREKGFGSFRILDYSEGVESSTPLTHRYSEGTIQLVRNQ